MINFYCGLRIMKDENVVIIEYQDNFAHNLSNYAYGKILEENSNLKCCYINNPKQRDTFEKTMENFNLNLNYISLPRVNSLQKRSFFNRKKYFLYKDFRKRINKKKKNSFLNLTNFKIDDLKYISDDIRHSLFFSKKDFIISYDILEKITQSNSIGLYIDKNDENIDFDFINRAQVRINKYVKKPMLFIFTKKNPDLKIKKYIDIEFINFLDWREEFYFLTNCKHKIILNSNLSYSEGLWAAYLGLKDYSINIYDKRFNQKVKNKNWIAI